MFLKNEKTVLLAVLILLAVLTYWTIFSSSRLPGGDMSDTVSQGYPFFSYTESRLSQGELPLWNPYIFCGVPFYASFSSPVFYPLRGLPMILFGSEVAIRFLFPVHLILAGLFAWLFLKSISVSRWGSLVGAFAYASGAWANTLFYAGHGSKIICWAWLPLLLWAVVKWAGSRDTRYIAFGATAIGMQGLSSHPQMILYSSGCALILALFMVKKPFIRSTAVNLGGLAAILLLGGSLAAVQLYPGYLFSKHTSRGEDLSLEAASSYSLAPEETLTMFLPAMFGLRHGFTDSTVSGIPVYFGRLGLRLSSEFMGVSFFILGLIGLMSGKNRKVKFALLTLAVIGTIVSWGGYTPVFSLLYKVFPIFRKLRAPHMAAFVTTSSLAIASGMGFDALFAGGLNTEKLKKTMLVLAGASGLFLILLLAAEPVSKAMQASWWTRNGVADPSPFGGILTRRASLLSSDLLRAFTVTGIIAAMVFMVRKSKGSVLLFALTILAVASVELIPFNRNFQVFLPSTTIESMFPDRPQLRDMAGEGRVFPGGNELVPLGIRSVYGYHAAKPAATDRLMTLVRASSPWVLRQTAMTAFSSTEGNASWEQLRPALAEGIPGYPADPMPRAFIPRSVLAGSVDTGFQAIENGIDPQIRTYILDSPSTHDGVVGKTEILVDLPELVTVRTETSGPGFLVLADSWYPDWEVTVDGSPATLHRANGWMRGVQIPGGEHVVEFSYSNRNVVIGGILSGVALLLILLLTVLSLMKKKRLNA
ncbi:MAG: hypothetical protein KAH54_07500 [Candidatus Sabulitectum sp.]|nr:hypothetical protein [Candidatus Sabulitectum sp.]